MNIHPQKAESLNKEAVRIVSLLKVLEDTPAYPRGKTRSSAEHMIPTVMGPFEGPVTIRSVLSKGTLAIKQCVQNECVGFDEHTYKDFAKLLGQLEKEKLINMQASLTYLEGVALTWMVDTYKGKRTPPFLDFILDEIDNHSFLYKIHFPVFNLYIDNFFKIGNVTFDFFTKEYFDSQLAYRLQSSPQADVSGYESNRKKYQGKVFATYTIKAQIDKGREIALKQCALAVDVLKICSITTNQPDEHLGFDIDSRLNHPSTSEYIATRPHDIETFTVSMSAYQLPYRIDEARWREMHELGLGEFSDFLLSYDEEENELKSLIANSITRYGNAISETSLHQRVVELFTILESLLLKDEKALIAESVAKYLSRLVYTGKHKDKRKECMNLIREMYKVRSGLIHHAKRVDFKIEDLRLLQICVVYLLLALIRKLKDHTTKKSILEEIDDAILEAG